MTDKDDLTGSQLGEFILRELIGEGGFGQVYRCEQPTLGREAVVKLLHCRLRDQDVQLQRFLRESQLASRLDHPYAAHVYGFGIDEARGLLWIAMEHVHGITLKRWLSERGPMPLGEFVPFFEHVAEVVQTAHERGIVHRDLKPSNVMVIERAGRLLPKLLDFGVAKLRDGEPLPASTPETLRRLRALVVADLPEEVRAQFRVGASTVTDPSPSSQRGGHGRLTPDHATIGTPGYMAPEQWISSAAVGSSADLFALGVLAFEVLTGRRPFEGMAVAELTDLDRRATVPPLGGGFPPALDRVFQRALAKRPEERWGSALELAGALRAASGIGATRADLPQIDQEVREAWLAQAPQPLAESVAELDDAHNVHQARDLAEALILTLLRYLLAMALAMNARVDDCHGDPVLLELMRALARRELGIDERIRLLRLLVRRRTGPNGVHPVPELVALVTPNLGGTDGLDPILALYAATERAVAEDAVRWQLLRLIPLLTELLRRTAFVLDHALVVPRNQVAERWAGRWDQPRGRAHVSGGELLERHPMLLDPAGRVCLDLWPLVQAVPRAEGADPELYLFDGCGHRGAVLVATPSGIEQHDPVARDWLAVRVIAEIESKTRMRDQIRVAAQQWQDRTRTDALLWRGEVLAELERWMRHAADAVLLSDLEVAFVAACRRVARRARWGRRLLVAAVIGGVLAGFEYRAALKARMAEQIATEAEVEQGRQSLLHDDLAEAQVHLTEAYRRGERSPAVAFMLSRALQPRASEQARLVSTSGRMWSASFSPDAHSIVTTDDNSARVWDARTAGPRFTLRHGDTVYDARYSADGAQIVTACGDGIIRIWNSADGTLVREMSFMRADGKKSRYLFVAWSLDGKLVAAIDTRGEVVHVWSAPTGAPVAELRNDGNEHPALAFSADGQWLATSGGDEVHVFDTRTWEQSVTIPGPHIRGLSFDPSGPRLATGTFGGDASIWELPSGARVRHLREIGESIDAVAFSPNGQLIVAAGTDGAEQVWNAKSGALLSQGNFLRGKISSIEFDPTSKLLVAAGASGTIVVSDACLGLAVTVLDGPQSLIMVAHFDASSRRVVGASWDGTARVWDATSPYRQWTSPPIADDCGLAMSLEPDRRFIAASCRDHGTRVWDTAHDLLLAELPSVTLAGTDFGPAFPAVSAGGDRAAIARGNAVEVYELPGGRLLRSITHGGAVSAVAFAPSGHDLISGAVDGSLLVTHDGREPTTLSVSIGGIDVAGLLPDGRAVVTNARGQLQVYDANRGTVLAVLEVPTRVRLLRPSSDGLRLITIPSHAGQPSPPILWDLERYRPIARLDGHGYSGRVFSARFFDLDREIGTVGNDGTVRLWDATAGRLLKTYRAKSRFLADVAVNPEGSVIMAGGSDGVLWFWDRATARPVWTLQAHKGHIVGVHLEGDGFVTRGFGGDVSRWTLPRTIPEQILETCDTEHGGCGILSR